MKKFQNFLYNQPLVFSFFILFELSNICVYSTGIFRGSYINDPPFKRGSIIDSVPCIINKNFNFAVYLPVKYCDSLKWPVIYIFDPAARGKVAIETFIQAAEKYGYILICSNNSKNRLPLEKIGEIAGVLLKDTWERFSIDTNRIYVSGFSGGSRVATMMALSHNSVSGVIACGAGFPIPAYVNNNYSFDYYGLVGDKDANYLEMCDLENKFENQKLKFELEVFAGGHEWPAPNLLQNAVEWMELQAMKKNVRKKDSVFLKNCFEKSKERLDSVKLGGDLIDAVRLYRYLIFDFPENPEVINYQRELDSIVKTKSYRKALKKLDKLNSEEIELKNSFIVAFKSLLETGLFNDSIRYWWEGSVKTMKNMESHGNQANRDLAARVLSFLKMNFYESGTENIQLKNYKLAIIIFKLEAMVQPENSNIYYRLARAYAFEKDIKNSVKSLEKSIKLGFKDEQYIKTDTAFNLIRDDDRLKLVISGIGKKKTDDR